MIIFHGTWYGSVFERLFITYLSDATAASHMYRSKPAGIFMFLPGKWCGRMSRLWIDSLS
jgi:hypothetical protein